MKTMKITSQTITLNGKEHRIYTAYFKSFSATASNRTRAIINVLNFVN